MIQVVLAIFTIFFLLILSYLYLKIKNLEVVYESNWFLLNSLAKQVVKNTNVTSEGLSNELNDLYAEFPESSKKRSAHHSAVKVFYPDKYKETLAKLTEDLDAQET